MRYSVEVTIQCPIEAVHEKFVDLDQRKLWQKGLISQNLVSGLPFQVGARTDLVFEMGNKEMTMVEKIIENDLPNKIVASYEAKGVYNVSHDSFQAIDTKRTKYISDQDFQMSTMAMKVMSVFIKSMFKKQTLSTMIAFKDFCEDQV